MMHIIDISCISPQDTYGAEGFNSEVIPHAGHQYMAKEPDYKSFISRGALRRMGKASRLGIGAGHPLIQRHSNVDGIIISTGNGGLGECVQFLDQIIKYDEGTLTPTHFVNSTANSISGSLALSSKNKGYNATFVGHGFGFESALLDALMHFEEGNTHSLLVGGVDEISAYNSNIERHRGSFKAEETTSSNLLKSTSRGTVTGEGAAMFMVSNDSKDKLASVLDVGMIFSSSIQEVQKTIIDFLTKNKLQPSDIDTLILGMNGDRKGDQFYQELIKNDFGTQTILTFKNLVGDYPTVSSFALWMATQNGNIPQEAIYRKGSSSFKTILIYNHYHNEQHGFILVEKAFD